MAEPRFTRRVALRGATAAAAGLAGAVAVPAAAVTREERHGVLVPPVPIPGEVELAPGQVIHVWAPGSSEVTLPFSGATLQGLDTEPTTIRDFNGFAAVALHAGRATAADGTVMTSRPMCAPSRASTSTRRTSVAPAVSASSDWTSSCPVRARRRSRFTT